MPRRAAPRRVRVAARTSCSAVPSACASGPSGGADGGNDQFALASEATVCTFGSMFSVLIVSQDPRFLDCVENALRREGITAVSLLSSAKEINARRFRPRAIVVDPAAVLESRGGELARCLGSYSGLAAAPIFSISSAAKRVEVADLIGALHRLEATTPTQG